MGKISDYARVIAAKLTDVFVVDQTDNGTTETKSATVEQIGTAIGTLQNFADLDTSNKNLVDAINEIASYTPVYGNTASGAIATFDTSLALPLQDCEIAINAVQESGTPTPSSPKAISGFTGANITQAPVYERVIATTPNTQTADGITVITKANGLIEVNGTANANGTITFDCNPFVIPSIEGRTMRLNNSFSGGFTVRFYNGSTEIDYWALNATNRTVTNYSGMGGQTVNRIAIAYSSGASVTNGTLLVDFIANSTTTAISWLSEAGTVYGGSLDVTSGVLTVTHRYRLMQSDAPSFTESITTNYTTYYTKLSNLYTDIKATGFIDVISDKFVGVKTSAGNDTNIVYIQNGYANFRVNNGDFASAADFKTWIQTNGIELVYELATPTTYQLTPTQIGAIVAGGVKTTNNVFTDTNGNTSVVYACSLKDYIEGQ